MVVTSDFDSEDLGSSPSSRTAKRGEALKVLKAILKLKKETGPCILWPFGKSHSYGRIRFSETGNAKYWWI